jgi:hypothetical protein
VLFGFSKKEDVSEELALVLVCLTQRNTEEITEIKKDIQNNYFVTNIRSYIMRQPLFLFEGLVEQ